MNAPIAKLFKAWLKRIYWYLPSTTLQLHSDMERAFRAGFEKGRWFEKCNRATKP